MKKLAALACTAALLATTAAAQVAPRVVYTPQGNGQWFVAPNGCAYTRTQAPGQPVMWIRIVNPHHIGLPRSSPNCPSIWRG